MELSRGAGSRLFPGGAENNLFFVFNARFGGKGRVGGARTGFLPAGLRGARGKALLAPPRKTLRTRREPNPRNTDIEKLSIGNGFYADKLGKT